MDSGDKFWILRVNLWIFIAVSEAGDCMWALDKEYGTYNMR
jgi:hypothetical protein